MTHNKFIEVMSVPVLSTAHLPGEDAVQDAPDCATYEGGWFVRLCEKEIGEPAWLDPVRLWARRIVPAAQWVRFDRDADIIFGLEVYKW